MDAVKKLRPFGQFFQSHANTEKHILVSPKRGKHCGGGIDGSGSDVLLIDNSTLVDNIASIEGGGYYAVVGRMTCTNSTLAGKAANFGGGLFNSNGVRRDSVTAPWRDHGERCGRRHLLAQRWERVPPEHSHRT